MKRYQVNIIILNYEGRELLSKYLPSLVEASKASAHQCTVTVLDNCSTDGSVDYVKQHFPGVKIVRAKENKVLCSYNDVVRELEDDIVILLNNDIGVDKNFVDPLVAVFDQYPDTFFVSTRGDRSKAIFRMGTLIASLDGFSKDQFGHSFNTGMGAFDRKKFVELGGYDDLYLPGRYEDLDLCYRGWKRGWKGYYEPQSVPHHEGEATFKKRFSENEIERMVFRNSIFFMVKNISDPVLTVQFWVLLLPRLLRFLLMGKFHMIGGFFEACSRLPEVLSRKKKVQKDFVLKDREVIQLINTESEYSYASK